MKRIILMSLATVFLAGCQDARFPTGSEPEAMMEILDGTDVLGNPDFFWYPPIAAEAPVGDADFESDNFDPNLSPTVRVCKGTADTDGTCGVEQVVEFTNVQLNADLTLYQVDWDTKLTILDDAFNYRIFVVLNPAVGFADVDVAANGSELRTITGDVIPLKDGRTLAIKFRLEAGIRCFLFDLANPGAACAAQFVNFNIANQITLPNGSNLFIPAQSTLPPSTVTVQDCTDGAGNSEDLPLDLPPFGGCIEVLADPPLPESGLTEEAIVSLCDADLSSLSPLQEDLVTLHKEDGGVVTALPHAEAICPAPPLASVSSNPLVRFARAGWNAIRGLVGAEPLYAVRWRGDIGPGGLAGDFSRFGFFLPAKIEKIAGDGQDALLSTDVGTDPAVKITDRNGDPVANATVTFEVITNDGTVVPLTATTAALVGNPAVDGILTAAWTVGSTPGLNELKVAGQGLAVAPADPHQPTLAAPGDAVPVPLDGNVVFTATGVDPDLTISSLTHTPAAPTTGDDVIVGVVVQNVGTTEAAPTTLEIRIDGINPQTLGVVVLAAGASSGTLEFNLGPLAVGEHTVTATADATAVVDELNEGNNTAADVFTVVDATVTLISCGGDLAGDQISRGFYVPAYPGVTLAEVDLFISARTAGDYTFSLTARSGTYDGTVIGTSNASVTLTSDQNDNQQTTFSFPSPAVVDGSLVTFAISQVAGPAGALVFYSVPNAGDVSCPVIQTDGTTPPLDTFRRNGVHVIIRGTATP